MTKTRGLWRMLTAVLAAAVLCCCLPLVPVSAAGEHITVCVDNKGGDDQPFMRIFLSDCMTEGPYTITFQIRVSDMKRMPSHPEGGKAYVNIWHPKWGPEGAEKELCQNKEVFVFRTNTKDWQTKTIKFDNVTKWMLAGSTKLVSYALIDIGCIFTKAKVEVRDFQVKNAAGDLVWSFDTDPDLGQVEDLRDIGEVNPEPLILKASFGNSGAAAFPVTKEGATAPDATDAPTDAPTKAPTKAPTAAPTKAPTKAPVTPAAPTDTPAETTAVPEETTEALPEETAETTEATQAEPSDSQPTATTAASAEPETVVVRKINWKVVGPLIALGVVAAAGAAVAIVYYVKKKKK